MQTLKKLEVGEPSPTELAEFFWNQSADYQASFFNSLGRLSNVCKDTTPALEMAHNMYEGLEVEGRSVVDILVASTTPF